MHISSVNTICYRRLIFSAGDCFLSGKALPDCDINYFIQVPENVNKALSEFYTLLADLTLPQETLWQNVYHRTRSEINSFLNNQAYEHQVIFNLSEKELQKFMDRFNQFAALKKIRKAEAARIKAYNKAGVFAVSFIKQQDKFVCINFYRVTAQRATNLYSFHLGHEFNGLFNASHIGRAHRALHWLDMLAFKKMNVPCYDFCGWYAGNTDTHLLNINAFKEQFTTHKVKEYSGVIYNSRLLKLLLKAVRKNAY